MSDPNYFKSKFILHGNFCSVSWQVLTNDATPQVFEQSLLPAAKPHGHRVVRVVVLLLLLLVVLWRTFTFFPNDFKLTIWSQKSIPIMILSCPHILPSVTRCDQAWPGVTRYKFKPRTTRFCLKSLPHLYGNIFFFVVTCDQLWPGVTRYKV